jgi:hypothetical protein
MTGMIKYEASQGGELDVMTLGRVLADSGYFSDAKDAAQAIVKVLAGREMGIGSIAAMTGIYLVKGRVTLSANLMAAQIKRSGKYNYRVARLDDTGCELVFFEGNQEIGRSSFTADDAKAAGLLNSSDPWRKTPRNMYFARAISNGAKWYTPDVFSGPVYTPDEMDGAPIDVTPQAPARPPRPAHNADGEVIDAEPEADPYVVSGPIYGDPVAKFNGAGDLYVNLTVAGAEYIIRKAAAELQYLEAGDLVMLRWHEETNSKKKDADGNPLRLRIVDEISGPRNADGDTAWQERAAEAEATNTDEPEPAAAGMPEGDLPAHL